MIATVSVWLSPSVTSCSTFRLDSKFTPPVTVILFSSRKDPSVFSSSVSLSSILNPVHGCLPVHILVNAVSLNVAVASPYTAM